MNAIDPKRAVIFIGVFAVIAFIESYLWNGWNTPRQGPASRETEPINSVTVRKPAEEQSARPTVPANSRYVEKELEPSVGRPSPFEIEERLTVERAAREAEMRQREQQLATQKAAEEAAERQRRAEEAAAAHARFLARYLNSDVARTPGTKAVALVVISENGKFNRVLSAAVADRLKADSVQILPSFFKPEFVSDGLFNSAFAEPTEIFKKLELAKSLDAVLFARQKVEYSTSPALENLITATMELELTAFPTTASADSQTWSFRAPGPGFKQSDARAAAEERIIKQIAGDTKMSLTALFTNN